MSALVSSLRTASGLWCDVVDTLHKPIVQVRSTFLKHTETYWKRICPTKWYFTNTKSLVQRPFPDTVTGPSPAPRDFLWRGNKIVKNFWTLWMKRSILTWAWACSSSYQAPSRDCQTPHCCSWRESMDLQAWPYAWRWRFHHSVKRLPVGCSKVLRLTSALLGSVRVRAQVVHAPVQGLGGGEHLLRRQKLFSTLTFNKLEEEGRWKKARIKPHFGGDWRKRGLTCSPTFLPDFLEFVFGPGVRKLFSLRMKLVARKVRRMNKGCKVSSCRQGITLFSLFSPESSFSLLSFSAFCKLFQFRDPVQISICTLCGMW